MTTIATDGRSMAGDSLTSSNAYILNYAPKIHRAADGRIFGCTGFATDATKFRKWMQDGGDTPTLDADFCALILNPDGTVDWIGKDLVCTGALLPASIGSGDELAMGAMLAGCSPERAIEIAMMRDRKTGGEITVEHITEALREVA